MKRYLLFLFVISVVVTTARSPARDEAAADPGGRYHVGHYGDVRAMCRVGDALWIGTGGGLFIYDLGSNEVTDHITIGSSLPSNSIRAISARGDSVYVGTDEGLAVFTSGTRTTYTDSSPGPYAGSPLSSIRGIDFGLDGRVYLATNGRGLGVLGTASARVITREDSLLDDKVYGMVQEDVSTYYFATSTGLCAFRDSVWVSFRAGAGIPRAEIRQIELAPESEGGFYLVVGRRGVYGFDGDRARRVTEPGLFPENAVAAIAVDGAGKLWACGSQGGVASYRDGHWTAFGSAGDGHRSRRWRSAAADRPDGAFFGSADGRVLWIRDDVVTDIRLPEGLPSAGVQALTTDSTGAVYALNGSYLLRMARGLDSFSVERSEPVVVAFAVSPDGQLWTATRWGVYRRDGDQYVGIEVRLSERQPLLSAIGFGPRGFLWLGTQAGNVHRFDGQVWMRMVDAGDLNLGAIHGIDTDGTGRLWVRGASGGVAYYRYGKWTSFGPPAYGESPARLIAVTPAGVPVLATGSGLWAFDGEGSWGELKVESAPGHADSSGTALWQVGWPSILSLDFGPGGEMYVGTEDGVAVSQNGKTGWITYEDGIGGLAATSVLAGGDGDVWVGFRADGLTRWRIGGVGDRN